MAPKKKNILPSIEIIIVLIFFLSFIVWAASKCNATKDLYQEQAMEEEGSSIDSATENTANTSLVPNATNPADPNATAQTSPTTTPIGSSPSPSPATPALTTSRSSVYATKLYVSIDGMNMRRGPSLDSAIMLKMPLFEELTFMNEVTDSTQLISLGDEMANEPWVKVKSKKGHIGWVYGAGVHYYKRKRQ